MLIKSRTRHGDRQMKIYEEKDTDISKILLEVIEENLQKAAYSFEAPPPSYKVPGCSIYGVLPLVCTKSMKRKESENNNNDLIKPSKKNKTKRKILEVRLPTLKT
ncbi:hypothetical protein NPIL_333301 [Nephila pilipes]|uniref:Uncharacterized protein n=1 Tax=Nephila pilipes TaxID=299642 RepID=A0A8X6TAW5_NEPPI|nr:hypothetical protein NPIL_333301 [Nephila pilipes]